MNENIGKTPNLANLLLHFRRSILEKIKKNGIKSELTFSQVEIIQFIGESGKKTMKSIADYMKIKPPSVTELIKEMEEKKLVTRVTDKVDRRIVSVALTESAKKNYILISKHKEVVLEKMISRLNQKDQETLERLIKVIIDEE